MPMARPLRLGGAVRDTIEGMTASSTLKATKKANSAAISRSVCV